jgi:hypothetical protein
MANTNGTLPMSEKTQPIATPPPYMPQTVNAPNAHHEMNFITHEPP